ncbi:hypothetical protein BRD56_05750 [Thermoplasmatales archaeon SW_10_69_26]|nr:MAG: hypothetical protein BRD56_05750 [Thermoplasmatales archaeon SW_10_69_26]
MELQRSTHERLFRRACLLFYTLVALEVAHGRLADARVARKLLNEWLHTQGSRIPDDTADTSFRDGLLNRAGEIIDRAEREDDEDDGDG